MSVCETCGAPTADANAVIAGQARYDDTLGGHADRHTLVVEAAERTVGEAKGSDR